MKRQPLATSIAFAATTALLLAACGSGEEKPEVNDKTAGVEKGDKKSARPSTGAVASASAERPTIKLPPDIKHEFSPESTGDGQRDAILKDNAEYIRALDAAIIAGKSRLPALEFYTEGEAATDSFEWVKDFKEAGLTITGTVRYYNRKVSTKSKTSASISYCGDETKGYSKVIKTGEVRGDEVTKNSYVSYGLSLVKNSTGTWEALKISAARGAAVCQP